MNKYEDAVKRTLEQFCREDTGRATGWYVETWLHPTTRSVRSVTVVPEFEKLGFTQRVNVLFDYLRAHLSEDEFVHLSMAMPLTPYEYEHRDGKPDEGELVAAK